MVSVVMRPNDEVKARIFVSECRECITQLVMNVIDGIARGFYAGISENSDNLPAGSAEL
jgi:hypothetical protein